MSDISSFLDSYVPPDPSAMVASPDESSLFASITPPTSFMPSGNGILADLGSLLHATTGPITQFYGDQAAIARAKGLTAIANAQTANAVQTAKVGLPSPQFLIIAGLGLVGALALSRRR